MEGGATWSAQRRRSTSTNAAWPQSRKLPFVLRRSNQPATMVAMRDFAGVRGKCVVSAWRCPMLDTRDGR